MKKWKIASLIASQAALTYAVFVICIHEPKTIAQQVQESVADEQSNLRNKEGKLRSIMFKNTQRPNTITIVETKKDIKPSGGRNGLEMLSAEDAAFLVDVANGKQ
jgi:hypothetical protein